MHVRGGKACENIKQGLHSDLAQVSSKAISLDKSIFIEHKEKREDTKESSIG